MRSTVSSSPTENGLERSVILILDDLPMHHHPMPVHQWLAGAWRSRRGRRPFRVYQTEPATDQIPTSIISILRETLRLTWSHPIEMI